ncbi:MAG: hypothetical protein NWS46_08365, partial [Cyclobacteriaceae bacterium]|nr:hypothetical protein [Cyclobacteriaceae bacterium]
MKKLLIICLILGAAEFAYPQKGSVTKASAYLAKNDLASAKAEIDMAITIEKNSDKAKTWFERGRIYQAIATSEDESLRSLDSDAIAKTMESFQKVKSMENETAPQVILADQNIASLWGKFINDGGTVYGEDHFEEAYENFLKALLVKPSDSLTLLYAGVCAQQVENYANTLKHYYKLDELGYGSVDVYATLVYIERAINTDEESALKVVKKAQQKYPNETRFGQEEISILINLKRLDQAKNKLIESIKEDPENASLHLNLAIMYDNIAGTMMEDDTKKEEGKKTYELALVEYLKTIEIEPDNYVANYNAGALYVNQAKEFYDKVNGMDLKTYQKE